MKPPVLARAIVAAVTAPADYDSVVGDLHEEYALRAKSTSRSNADRWYWSQTLRSVPDLLAYSRPAQSRVANATTVAVVIGVMVVMLIVAEFIGDAISIVYHHASGLAAWPYFLGEWSVAALFGALLAAIFRSRGLRLTLFSACVLIASIAVPIAFGFSSRLTLPTWLLLLGALPAMSIGTAAYQLIRRRH